MAYTQNDLDNVRSVIAQGLRSVVFEDGRQVHFRSVGDLLRVKNEIEKDLDQRPKRRAYTVHTQRGL
jgi:hypothetical protein